MARKAREPRDPPWLPVPYDVADVDAFKAMAKGTANADQQGRALRWLIDVAAGTYEISFRSDADGGERDSSFAEGRRFVGTQIVKLVNMPPALVAQLRKANG